MAPCMGASSLPHARGGVSGWRLDGLSGSWSSPRTWGCFREQQTEKQRSRVFPTHVGVFPAHAKTGWHWLCLPHARGGVSETPLVAAAKLMSSPRTWGCFYRNSLKLQRKLVFPTHVGVFLRPRHREQAAARLPHARGGVSPETPSRRYLPASSPRTWGCFWCTRCARGTRSVFPTHVGVFLPDSIAGLRALSLPHARGGVSQRRFYKFGAATSSPRTWGCFHQAARRADEYGVFPTHVGVFPGGVVIAIVEGRLPHARGGVSRAKSRQSERMLSSPRTWGCFLMQGFPSSRTRVFPTHVGVFLFSRLCSAQSTGLPHARGGVSARAMARHGCGGSSPRTWGCFRHQIHLPRRAQVFPTHVGVFPKAAAGSAGS